MKRLKIICISVLLLGLMAGPAIAQIGYSKDILEPGNPPAEGICDILLTPCTSDLDCAGGALTCLKDTLKTWDETWDLPSGETMDMDIWNTDVPDTGGLLTSGVYITFDPALLNVTNVIPWDTNNGGLWDPAEPFSPEPGIWTVSLLNFSCVTTDEDGDILLGKVTFQSQSSGSTSIIITTIPNFDTLVGCSESGTNYDLQIMPNTITINKGNGTSTTTSGSGTTTTPTSTTSPSTTTSAGSSTTTTEPSSSSWQTAYAMMWGEDKEQKLSLLRYFRDEAVARNKVVRNYVSLLYRNSSEIAGVFIKHPLLCLETRKLVEALLPSIESFFETEKLVLTAGQKDRVESFLNQFESKVTPELKGIIQDFRKDLRDGRIFLPIS